MIAAAKIIYLQEQIARYDDKFAYKELFVSLYSPLFRFALTLVSREQADEIVSDVFIHIWEKRKRIDSISNLRVYLYKAVKNTALNYIAKQNRSNTTDINEAGIELPSIYFNPEQLLITAEMIQRIRMAVDKLPPQCKLIFKLVKEDELKYREVAEILGISVKTVESQVTIALRKIGNSIHFDVKKAISS